MKARFAPFLASLPALLVGCGSDGGAEPVSSVSTEISAALAQASSCEDLLARIQTEAMVAVERTGDAYRGQSGFFGGPVAVGGGVSPNVNPGVAVDDVATGGPLPPQGNAAGTPTAPPSAAPGGAPTSGAAEGPLAPADPGSSNGSNDGNAQTPRDFSETNNQIAGVDEADIVKTDGFNIYVLHGTQLFTVDVRDPSTMLVLSNAAIEGQPTELFVKDGLAVVFSAVSADAELLADQKAALALCSYGYNQYTKTTVLDVSAPQVEVLREVYTQGYYVSSRRIDDVVRGVISGGLSNLNLGGPPVEYFDIFGQPRSQADIDAQIDAWVAGRNGEIAQSTLDDWLPLQRERVNGELVAVERDCSSHYVPSPGLTQPGATTVVGLDLSNVGGSLTGTTILGDVSEVYSNAEKLILAQRDYRFEVDSGSSPEQTVLHQFALSGNDTVYEASGFLPGHIVDQFSIDEQDGVIRVSTTGTELPQTSDPATGVLLPFRLSTVNRVYTLAAGAEGLEQLGQTAPLGHEGETIFATRFLGDKGYVVTFRRTDPLLVIDLSDPAAPTQVGELLIPGFSNYLHPLGEDHLLAIGRDSDPNLGDLGLALQIFDISDPTAPSQVFKHVEPGYSIAEGEHKAFNYYANLGMLVFPFFGYSPNYSSTLEVFGVSTVDGFEKLASIDHAQLLDQGCFERLSAEQGVTSLCQQFPAECPFYEDNIRWQCQSAVGEVRRGLFIEDSLYSISSGGILAHGTTDFDLRALLDLPDPAYYAGGYSCGFPVDVGVVGVGVATPGIAVPEMTGAPLPTSPTSPPPTTAQLDPALADPVASSTPPDEPTQ